MEDSSIEDYLTSTETISISSTEDDTTSSSSTFTPIISKITESIIDNFETTEDVFISPPTTLESTAHSSFNPVDYAVFGVMLAMSGEHLNFHIYISRERKTNS